jgi:hypothetical protein
MNGGVGQQGDVPRPLDGQRQLALVFGTIARNAPGNDFPALRNEIAQRSHVLVIYLEGAVGTKTADLTPVESTSFASNDHGLSPYDQMA